MCIIVNIDVDFTRSDPLGMMTIWTAGRRTMNDPLLLDDDGDSRFGFAVAASYGGARANG
jgi:hypothetical protein